MRFCSVCDTDPNFTTQSGTTSEIALVLFSLFLLGLTESRPNDYPSNVIPGHKHVRGFLRPLT